MTQIRLISAVPIIPAQNIALSAAWYQEMLGFDVHHVDSGYGIVGRDDVYIHFWGPSDIKPADSMTMTRLGVADIERWYEHCLPRNIVHPNAPLKLQEWGATEFAVTDLDGNLVTFFEFKDAS
ncbi:MAG: VOC family protein [Actinomycetia bacterium]|nr:VOC family protein [Actinomycetes bacterium]